MKKKTDNAAATTTPITTPTAGGGGVTMTDGGSSTGATNLHGRTQSISAKHNVPVVSGGKKSKHNRNNSRAQSVQEDVPPPLPQRNNVGRKSLPTSPEHVVVISPNKHVQVSDLDTSLKGSKHNVSMASAESSSSRKRSKTKNKAHSDPKMSTQMFIQMEARNCMSDGCEPPPLPPRQPSLAEPVQSLSASGGTGGEMNGRYPPNSINTLLNYPLISTCTPVRDNFNPFPLSHRPNIVQQLQQSQQNKSGVSIMKHVATQHNKQTVN